MKKRLLIAAACVIAIIAAFALVTRLFPSERARYAWKEMSLSSISENTSNPTWLENELAQLRTQATNDSADFEGWISDHIIVMRNGDWIAYANICQKENRRIRDLFLGHGSDGNWYFSTYHFCKGMIVLKMDEQPENLTSFTNAYFLRKFDGRSDECLQETWLTNSRQKP